MACSFLKAEADRLTSALYKLILLTLGASKFLPNVYHFAPLSLQGLEAPNFYVEQGICKVSKLLTHGDSGNLTSDLIAVSMEQAQLEVSIGTPLLQVPFDQYSMLCTQCWVKGLWQFASEHCILLENPTYHTSPLQCIGNEYIMECLVLMDYYGNADLIHINHCQIRKQVLTMSDIIYSNGVYLHCDAHTFIHTLQPPNKYDWANEQPSHSDWNLWRAALKILTSQNLSLPFFDHLSRWTKSPHTPSEWHYSPTTRCLYKSLLGGYYCYAPQTSNCNARFLLREYSITPLPPNSCIATTHFDRWGYAILMGWATTTPHKMAELTTVRELIATWEDNWPLLCGSNFCHVALVVEVIMTGTASQSVMGPICPKCAPNLQWLPGILRTL